MASAYPAALDTIAAPGATLDAAPTHSVLHTKTAEAALAAQAVLGLNPQGSSATVAARLAAITAVANAGVANADAAYALATVANNVLGPNPQGIYANVDLFLDALSAQVDTKAQANIPWTTVNAIVTIGGNSTAIDSHMRYRIVAARTVEWDLQAFIVSTPTAGALVIQCPLGPIEYGANCGNVVGNVMMLNVGVGRRIAQVYSIPGGGGGFQIDVNGGSGYLTPATHAVPWTWATGSEIVGGGSFRYA